MSTLTDITDLAVAGYLKRSKQVAIDGGIEPISPLVYVEIAKMIQQEEAAISAVRESIGDEQFKKIYEKSQ